MKKKLILSVLFIVCALLRVSAQELKFGVEAGANWSHYKNDKAKAEQVGNMGTGFQLSGTVDYEFRKHWMLMSGLTFMQTRSSMMLYNSSMPYFPDTEIKMGHLNIPVKVGYNIRFNKNISLIPYVGLYGSVNFNLGKCDVKEATGSNQTWKPMDGYSYTIPSDLPYEVVARIDPFRRWNWGALGGIKMVIAHHYTLSLQYYESIKKVQKQCNLRNFGYQLSIGYQF